MRRRSIAVTVLAVAVVGAATLAVAHSSRGVPGSRVASAQTAAQPLPLLADGTPVDWWFVFKFNAASFPGCDGGAVRSCPFGGTVEEKYQNSFGQQFVYASSADSVLQQGRNACLGDTNADPVGATFAEVYDHALNYVVWNDQFKGDPIPNRDSPWGHSKGLVAWDDSGNGFVMQVSTPSLAGLGQPECASRVGRQLARVRR